MKKIMPDDIVAFAPFCGLFPIEVDPFYGRADHPENHFGQVYHAHAQIWGHRDLVKIVLLASKRLHKAYGWTLVVKDCLRTVDGQIRIAEAPISKANPQWFEDPPFMSSPGKGAHPRGMAVDLAVKDIDMGTPVDCLTEEASRTYTNFPPGILENRNKLEEAMVRAGKDLGMQVHPLSNEWWDFRFLPEIYNQYAPLSDEDLRPEQRMVMEPIITELEPDRKIMDELNAFSLWEKVG